jgi:hypothetical protein
MSGYPIGSVLRDPRTGEQIELTEKGWVTHGQQMPLPEADQDAMKRLHQDALDTQYLDQKAQQFIQGMDPQKPGQGSFATGPIYKPGPHIPLVDIQLPNPVHGIVGAQDPRLGNLESITNQTWVHMRPEGSGAIRGYEAGDFKRAFPNVEQWGPANQEIAARLHQDALIASQKLQFIDSFIRSGHGDYAAANAAWQANFGNPQAAAAAGPQAAQAGPPPIQPPQPDPIGNVYTGGDPRNPGSYAAPQPPPPQQAQPAPPAVLNWTPDKGLHP